MPTWPAELTPGRRDKAKGPKWPAELTLRRLVKAEGRTWPAIGRWAGVTRPEAEWKMLLAFGLDRPASTSGPPAQRPSAFTRLF